MSQVFSGHRLQFLKPEQYSYAWADLKKKMLPLSKLFATAMQEPLFLDDSLKHYNPHDLLMHGLTRGELILCLDGEQLAGFIGLTEIVHERSAKFEAWAHPTYREGFTNQKKIRQLAREVIEYAFKPYGPITEGGGLGLKKLKAEIAYFNKPAWRACKALGFTEVGMSLLDGLYNSHPVDIVYLELFNPMFFDFSNEGQIHGTQSQPAAGLLSDLHTTASIPAATGSRGSGTTSDVSHGRDITGERSRGADTEMAAIHKPKSNGPRRQKPV